MSRHRVGDLVIQTGAVQIYTATGTPADGKAHTPARADLRAVVRSLPLGWRPMVASGLALLGAGITFAWSLSSGLVGILATSCLMSLGCGLVMFGAYKRAGAHHVGTRGLPPPGGAELGVVRERSRRVRSVLERMNAALTYERLLSELRWTEVALLSALLHMKETGEIIEDLDLDTGEWIYRLQDPALARQAGTAQPMLEERQARYRENDS